MDSRVFFNFIFYSIFCAKVHAMFEELFKTVTLIKNKQVAEMDVCLLYL